MSNRTRRHVWSFWGAAAAVLASGASARAAPPEHAAPAAVIADPDHLLAPSERGSLERSLRGEAVASGSPLSILVVARLRHETADELARRTFISEGLDAPGPPRVLLVVAARERRAAIETGQGVAGIVPEIDARRIVGRLQSSLGHHRLAAALDEAVAAIAASARATAERRRPAPPDPQEAHPAAAPGSPAGVTDRAPQANETEPKPEATPAAGSPAGSGRSLMPAGYVLAGLIVLALALRRRRRNAEDRVAETERPASGRKPGRDVKSIGDRRIS